MTQISAELKKEGGTFLPATPGGGSLTITVKGWGSAESVQRMRNEESTPYKRQGSRTRIQELEISNAKAATLLLLGSPLTEASASGVARSGLG